VHIRGNYALNLKQNCPLFWPGLSRCTDGTWANKIICCVWWAGHLQFDPEKWT